MNHVIKIAPWIVAAAGLLYVMFFVGTTGAYVWTLRHTGSEALSEVVGGFMKSVLLPATLLGYEPNNRTDEAFLACLRKGQADPASVAANPAAYATQISDCSSGYATSRIDLNQKQNDELPVHVQPYGGETVNLHFANHSEDKILLGADFVFTAGGHTEYQHVSAIAFPGQYADVMVQIGLLADPAARNDFSFTAIPSVARIKDRAVYGLAATQ